MMLGHSPLPHISVSVMASRPSDSTDQRMMFVRRRGSVSVVVSVLIKSRPSRSVASGTVTEAAGVLSFHPTQTAVWFDYNGDGWLDLFVGNEDTGVKRRPCELYRNNQDGTFTECAAAAGLGISAFVKGVVSGDYNNDGRPDLYVSVRDAANLLFRNDGPKGGDATGRAGWRAPERAK